MPPGCCCTWVAAGANRHDAPRLGPALAGPDWLGPDPNRTMVHLDCGYASGVTGALLDDRSLTGAIARRGVPAPLRAGKRWVVERTPAWMNGFGKLRCCTEKTRRVVEFFLFLTATFLITRCLIQRARTRSRWPGRPTSRRLK